MTADLLKRFHAGDVRALSRLISAVEDRADGYQDLLAELWQEGGRALRIGITGPPGAGKSSLVNCLVHEYLKEHKRVGIVAVDPTSPFTGGALLGDRVRMNEFPTDGSVYFRSMATRGATGGLAAAPGNVSAVLDAFGFDIALIETVGVGQVEIDVIDNCDVVVVVIVPESGDAVQTMKAGLMELADVFAVNKSDRPGAENLVADLRRALSLRRKAEGAWPVSVVATQAVNRVGVDKLFGKINDFVEFSRNAGSFEGHRRAQIRKTILNLLSNRFRHEFMERLSAEIDFDRVLDDIYQKRTNPYHVGDDLYRRFGRV